MKRFRAPTFMGIGGAALVAGLTIASPAGAVASPSAKASPSKNLTNGKVVKVSGKGFPANGRFAIGECDAAAAQDGPGKTDCNLANIVLVTASSKGLIPSTDFTFATGTIGDGTCNAKQTCYIAVVEPVNPSPVSVLIKVTISKNA